MIDFEALKKMDIEVVNEAWTAEEQAAFSKYLSERNWDDSFVRSEDKLVGLADEALKEMRDGKAKPLVIV